MSCGGFPSGAVLFFAPPPGCAGAGAGGCVAGGYGEGTEGRYPWPKGLFTSFSTSASVGIG